MHADDPISDDPGTILESYESIPRALPSVAGPAPVPPVRPVAAPVEEIPYRSPYRWTAPRILICDDGSLEAGEEFYVRSDKIVIGRTSGDIVIGHDSAMSSGHAEIARRDAGGKHAWVLRDLGSSNGTLVRARTVTLKPGIAIQLGSKRYRFEPTGTGSSLASAAANEPKTAMLNDFHGTAADLLPALVEFTSDGVNAGRKVQRGAG